MLQLVVGLPVERAIEQDRRRQESDRDAGDQSVVAERIGPPSGFCTRTAVCSPGRAAGIGAKRYSRHHLVNCTTVARSR
jgi:hypothetical protein